jgi:hypothetical protein
MALSIDGQRKTGDISPLWLELNLGESGFRKFAELDSQVCWVRPSLQTRLDYGV